MIKELFVDMDCVLVDLIEGIAKRTHFGLDRHQLEPHYEPGRYGFGHALERLYDSRGWARYHGLPSLETRFWADVRGDDGFWANLPKLPWADDLMQTVMLSGVSYWYLTSPSDCGFCLVGKDTWLTKHYGKGEGLPGKMIPCRDKWLLAKPGRLLIDDHDENVDRWIEHGGQAILFPAVHNRRHAEAGDDKVWATVERELNMFLYGNAT